jgi:hypothetical protein
MGKEYPVHVRRTNLEAHMTSASILPLAIMLATTSVFGQSFTLPPRIDPSKCPVELQVERSSGLFAYENAKVVPAEPVAPRTEQWFDLRMTNLLPHDIVAAEITAHGFSYKGRIIPVSDATPNIWKTVDVALDVKGNGSASRELSFDHFSAIRTIDVDSVTYADGSTWHASSPGACSVAPSLFMRISAQ